MQLLCVFKIRVGHVVIVRMRVSYAWRNVNTKDGRVQHRGWYSILYWVRVEYGLPESL